MRERNYIEDYKSIDIMKFIASIMVVCIHTLPFQSINPIIDNIIVGIGCRVAVPFFFITSGFLLFIKFNENKSENRKKVIKYIMSIIKVYMIWSIVYLILDNILGRNSSFTQIISKIFTSGVALQMWYFPAIIISIFIVYLWNEKLKLKGFIWGSIILYCIGLLGTTYYHILYNIPSIKQIIDCIIRIFGTTRNGVFFGVPYVGLGCIIAYKYKENYNGLLEKIKKIIILFITFIIIMSCEGLIIAKNIPNIKGRDMFILLPFVSYFLFLFVLSVNKYFKNDYKALRELSTLIFVTHIGIMYFININNTLLKFLITISISLTISILIIHIKSKLIVLKKQSIINQ